MTDLERIIEARERDVVASKPENHPNLVDKDEKFGLLYHRCSSECDPYHEVVDRLAALGPDSVALARSLYWLLEYLDTRDAGRAPLIEAEQAQDVLLAWAQAGEERGKLGA